MDEITKITNEIDEALGDIGVLMEHPQTVPGIDDLNQQLICIAEHLRRIKRLVAP